MKISYFKDKTVVVTGSSKGIGRTTALEFLKLGANVVINGRTPEKLDKTRQFFLEQGFEILAVAGDVTDFNFCKELIDKAVQKYGRIDHLINNAGLPMRGRFDELNETVIDQVIKSNLFSASYCSKLALPYLKETKGSIVFIS